MHDLEISAYLTTWNCIRSDYPFEAAIRSLLTFSSEVVVLDAGSKDGTFEALQRLHKEDWRIRIIREPVDVSQRGWALQYDLALKQHAREACHGKYLYQAEPFEVLTRGDGRKLAYCTEYVDERTPVLALPIYEYWGGTDWVRRDIYPAAPKLSLRAEWLQHGIPRGFQATDEHGLLYALPYVGLAASYVDRRSGEAPTYQSILDDDIESIREDPEQLDDYEARFHDQLDDLPVVHNFTWAWIDEELQRLRSYWSRFDSSFYHEDAAAISAWPFFEKNWSEVEEHDLIVRAVELERDGPGSISGETDFATRMPALKELPEDVVEWLRAKKQDQQASSSDVAQVPVTL